MPVVRILDRNVWIYDWHGNCDGLGGIWSDGSHRCGH